MSKIIFARSAGAAVGVAFLALVSGADPAKAQSCNTEEAENTSCVGDTTVAPTISPTISPTITSSGGNGTGTATATSSANGTVTVDNSQDGIELGEAALLSLLAGRASVHAPNIPALKTDCPDAWSGSAVFLSIGGSYGEVNVPDLGTPALNALAYTGNIEGIRGEVEDKDGELKARYRSKNISYAYCVAASVARTDKDRASAERIVDKQVLGRNQERAIDGHFNHVIGPGFRHCLGEGAEKHPTRRAAINDHQRCEGYVVESFGAINQMTGVTTSTPHISMPLQSGTPSQPMHAYPPAAGAPKPLTAAPTRN